MHRSVRPASVVPAVAGSTRREFLGRAGLLGSALVLGRSVRGAEQAKKAPELAFAQTEEAVRLLYGPREMIRYQRRLPGMGGPAVPSPCFFHPVTTPAGIPITDVAPADHRHHRGVFLAWVDVRGKQSGDFWGWGEVAPTKDRRIVNRSVEAKPPTMGYARMSALNEWMAGNERLLSEDLRAGFTFQDGGLILNVAVKLTPEGPVTLGRQAFGGFALRTRKDGTLTALGSAGGVTLPAPRHTEPDSDWPDAPWYGLHLKLADGKEATVAVVGRKENPPTRWHVVPEIGLINPCITAPGPVTLAPDRPLVLRYRVAVFDGPPNLPVLNRIAESWYLGVQN